MIRPAIIVFCSLVVNITLAQELPKIITSKTNYLPDFSYAGYHFGESQIPESNGKIINAVDFGVKANDELDDSKALLKAFKAANAINGNVILQLPAGKIILSDRKKQFCSSRYRFCRKRNRNLLSKTDDVS